MNALKLFFGGTLSAIALVFLTILILQMITPNLSIDTGFGYALAALLIGFIAGIFATKNYLDRSALKKR